MIEVLKQALEALEDVGVLIDTEWQAVHKNKANELRQAIAELESQEQNFCSRCGKRTNDIHTCTPPQRTWVGLTADEIWDEWLEQSKPERNTHNFVVAFTRAIEAKLKQKNGYAEGNKHDTRN